ncbi:MAG: hypothetical protein AB7V50_03330 [Vampirovibrionia bacterium]
MQINGQNNTQQLQYKKAERTGVQQQLQQQQANQSGQTNNSEVQNLQSLLARLDSEVSAAETETSGKSGSKPSGPPPEVQAELNKYGLTSTGSKEGDEAAIAQAKAQAQNKSNKA